MTGTDDAQELAERAIAVMWSSDAASAAMGMRLEEVGPGRAVVSMTVRDDMVNGWGLAHGGLVASLADSAFAAACNSHGTVTVAAGFDVTFLQSVRRGDHLVAVAQKRVVRGRSGVYDVTVRRMGEHGGERGGGERGGGDGEVVAEFRGRSRSLGRPILAD